MGELTLRVSAWGSQSLLRFTRHLIRNDNHYRVKLREQTRGHVAEGLALERDDDLVRASVSWSKLIWFVAQSL
jgi:hypothetical protein